MDWHIQFIRDSVDQIEEYPSPEAAIEAACVLIDSGCDVYGIGTGPLTDSIGRDEIARIHFGRATNIRGRIGDSRCQDASIFERALRTLIAL